MKNKLKFKVLSGFFLLTALLIIAAVVSINEFMNLSKSVNAVIDDNYKTIESSKIMLEALEREDSGILLLILGQQKEGRNIIDSSDKKFNDAYIIALNNITEDGEEIVLKNIKKEYNNYKSKWQQPIINTGKQGNIIWYQENIHKSFLKTKTFVNELMTLNQNSLYKEASILKEKSHRAIMPGIVTIIAGIVFSLLFNFFITRYFIAPIGKLAESIENYNPGDMHLKSNIKSEDEIKKLESAISTLILRLEKPE